MIKIFKRVIRLTAVITLVLFSYSKVCAQDSLRFRYPLDVTMSLSGNYGELRGGHFHNGIDFRVGGVVGAPIYATERGYISRIVVSPSGYGNGLYITHPNGYVSVYGHMHNFREDIADFVREKQYSEESFVQDITLSADVFPVKKGEKIGNAGNSGSSGGPHLHFELRDSDNIPLNIYKEGVIALPDNISPNIVATAFYGAKKEDGVFENIYIGKMFGTTYSSKYSKGSVIMVPETFYVCVDAHDKMTGTHAKLAVTDYKVYLDGKEIYHLNIDKMPIEKGKYINSLVEYRQRSMLGKFFIKSYVEPGCMFADKVKCVSDGLITLQDTLVHNVKIEVKDYLNNKSVKSFKVKRGDEIFEGAFVNDTINNYFAPWYLANIFVKEGLVAYLPAGALYSSVKLKVEKLPNVGPYSGVYRIGDGHIPIHSVMNLNIKCSFADTLLADKAVIASVGKNGAMWSVGGKYNKEKGEISANVGSFGVFTVAVDTIAPKVTTALKNGAAVGSGSLVFRISDGLSGIRSYRVCIDGHWVLAEFDAKTRRLIVSLKHAKITRGKKHNAVVSVVDRVGNEAVLKRSFIW